MHWIELIFGISPDGDSGAIELLILGVLLAASALLAARQARRAANTKRSQS